MKENDHKNLSIDQTALIETAKKDLSMISETPVSSPVIPLLQGALNEKNTLLRAALFGLMRSLSRVSNTGVSAPTENVARKRR